MTAAYQKICKISTILCTSAPERMRRTSGRIMVQVARDLDGDFAAHDDDIASNSATGAKAGTLGEFSAYSALSSVT